MVNDNHNHIDHMTRIARVKIRPARSYRTTTPTVYSWRKEKVRPARTIRRRSVKSCRAYGHYTSKPARTTRLFRVSSHGCRAKTGRCR